MDPSALTVLDRRFIIKSVVQLRNLRVEANWDHNRTQAHIRSVQALDNADVCPQLHRGSGPWTTAGSGTCFFSLRAQRSRTNTFPSRFGGQLGSRRPVNRQHNRCSDIITVDVGCSKVLDKACTHPRVRIRPRNRTWPLEGRLVVPGNLSPLRGLCNGT